MRTCVGIGIDGCSSTGFEVGVRVSPVIEAAQFQIAGCELLELATTALATPSGVPGSRWVPDEVMAAAAASAYGSFLSTEELGVDGGAFGISSLESRSMDPQQSFVLHVGYGALVGGWAGRGTVEATRASLIYRDVGVFVGVEPSGVVIAEASSAFSATGGAASITSGRFSYVLGLVGPCYTIDTACSSALAALHVSTAAVMNEDRCESGVALGTKVLSEAANYGTAVAGMTSAHGRCHTFDGRADGYCRGEGCGAFRVGRRRTSARSDVAVGGQVRRLTVLGSAVQQDGPSTSLTAPNGSSQRRLLESFPGQIGFEGEQALEAHGTGTALGDPIEVI